MFNLPKYFGQNEDALQFIKRAVRFQLKSYVKVLPICTRGFVCVETMITNAAA